MTRKLQLFVFIFTAVSCLNAQWVNKGPGGSRINCLAEHKGKIFAGTNITEAIYASADSGKLWIESNKGITGNYMSCFAAKNNTLYAGTSGGGIYKSTDNGKNWTSTGWPSSSSRSIFFDDSITFIGSSTPWAIYVSYNESVWMPVSKGFYIPVIIADAFTKFGGKIFAAANQGIYTFNRADTSWSKSDSTIRSSGIAGFCEYNGALYMCNGAGIYYTNDTGRTWAISYNAPVYRILSLGNMIVAGTKSGIFTSADGGKNWINPSNSSFDTRFLLKHNNEIFAGTTEGIFKTTDNCNSWTGCNTGFPGINTKCIIPDDNQILAGTLSNGIYFSHNYGEGWEKRTNGIGNITINSIISQDSVIVVASLGNGVYSSTDTGKNWNVSNNGVTVNDINAVIKQGKSLFALTSGGKIFQSVDIGAKWTGLDDIVGLSDACNDILCIGDTLFAATNGSGVFFSANKGNGWMAKSDGLSYKVFKLLIKDNRIYAGTDSGIFITDNFGDNWTESSNGLVNKRVRALEARGSIIFAGTEDGVYMSKDNGDNWVSVSVGMPSKITVNSLAMDDNTLYAATSSGVWSRSVDEITYVSEVNNKLSLISVYPNPNNGVFTIEAEIEGIKDVRIEILDILGKTVYSTQAENAGGRLVKQVIPGNLERGVYLIKINAGNEVYTKKLIVE